MDRLHETFVRLCEIRSPTGEEREVTDTVAAELRALGLEVSEDDAAGPAKAGAGNLLARLPGRSGEWVMFCAHIDTVPHEGLIEVVNDDGVFRSRGETILGADNKAAVAVFMELVARHAEEPPPVGIELLLTVAEEQGLRGAKAFDASALRSSCGFVLDHASAIGEVIVSSPTQQRVLADFDGVEAHAGIRPEDGSNAIAAAAAAISRMELGRLDEETTANVGLIEGGTSGNVVPGHCRVRRRDAQPRRRPRRRGRRRDDRGLRLGGERAWLRRRRAGRGAVSRLRAAPILARLGAGRGGPAPGGDRAGADCHRRRQRRQRADRRRLRLRPARQRHGGQPHRRTRAVSAANLDAMLEVCEAILVEAAADGA